MKRKMKLKTFILSIAIGIMPFICNAQCAMCRAVLESESSQNAAEGINDGILYLMVFPYLLVGGLGYYIYRTYKKSKIQA